jgi:hypothetical protein
MASGAFAGALTTNADGVRIGGYSFGRFHHPWVGDIDEVLSYGRVLVP